MSTATAAPKVVILGLFKNKAIMRIDGQKRILDRGQRSPEGITLISANSGYAVIEYNGQQRKLRLGQDRGSVFSEPATTKVRLWPNAYGMYLTDGAINGKRTEFLVDTGATFVALNRHHARQFRLRFREEGKPIRISTASGMEQGYRLKLRQVRLGAIKLRSVDAVVIDNDFPKHVLLGMSFLSRLKMARDGKVMVLEK